MAGSLIAAVFPPAARSSVGGRGPAGGVRRLPLAGPLPSALRSSEVVYGLGRIDASRAASRAASPIAR